MPDLRRLAIRNTPKAYDVSKLYLRAKRWIRGSILQVAIDGSAVTGEHGNDLDTTEYAFWVDIGFDGSKGHVVRVIQ